MVPKNKRKIPASVETIRILQFHRQTEDELEGSSKNVHFGNGLILEQALVLMPWLARYKGISMNAWRMWSRHVVCLSLLIFGCAWSVSGAQYVVAWGDYLCAQTSVPAGLTNVISIFGTYANSGAVTKDGNVVVWGSPWNLPAAPSNLTNVVQVAAGSNHGLALKTDGTLAQWPGNGGYADPITFLSGIKSIAAENWEYAALRSNGTAVIWTDFTRSTNDISGLTNVIDIFAGGNKTLALCADGVLYDVDYFGHPTMVDSNVTSCSASDEYFAYLQDGTVKISELWSNSGPGNAPLTLTNAVSLAAGRYHTLAITKDKRVVGWGNNDHGQITIPPGLSNVIAIAAGETHSLAIVSVENGAPVVVRHPIGNSVYSGSSVFLSCGVEGDSVCVQWQLNGADVPGATNASFWVTNIQSSQAGVYRAVARNDQGTAVSLEAIVNVTDKSPVVTREPSGGDVFEDSYLWLTVSIDGSMPLICQWRLNGLEIPGATNGLLQIDPARLEDEGYYDVVVQNPFGTVVSTNAFVHVVPRSTAIASALNTSLVWRSVGDIPWFRDNGDNRVRAGKVIKNQSSTLHTELDGPATIGFSWSISSSADPDELSFYVNGIRQTHIMGNEQDRLTFYLPEGHQILEWKYEKWSDSVGLFDTGYLSNFTYVDGPTVPTLTQRPSKQGFNLGGNATFSVAAYGTSPLRYRWQHNGVDVPGATNSTLVIENERTQDIGAYRVIVSNPYGSIAADATLFAYVGPTQTRDALDRWYLRDTNQLNKVRFAGNRFFALGDNGLLKTSVDGATWVQVNSGTTGDLCGVAYSSTMSRYVVVGSSGALATSTNGTNWTPLAVTTQDLTDIACKGSVFIALSNPSYGSTGPNFFYSSGGVNWSPIVLSNRYVPYMTAITVSGSYFVAAGGTPFALDIWRSLDGRRWTWIENTDQYVMGIASGGGETVLVGAEGWPRVSSDQGAHWYGSYVPGVPPGFPLVSIGTDITYGNGIFVVASFGGGLYVLDAAGYWSARKSVDCSFSSVAFGNNCFVALAGGNYPSGIYQSDSILAPRLSTQISNSNLAISVGGELAANYRLQTSSNLVQWSDCFDFTNTSGTSEVVATNVTGGPMRFYRVIRP